MRSMSSSHAVSSAQASFRVLRWALIIFFDCEPLLFAILRRFLTFKSCGKKTCLSDVAVSSMWRAKREAYFEWNVVGLAETALSRATRGTVRVTTGSSLGAGRRSGRRGMLRQLLANSFKALCTMGKIVLAQPFNESVRTHSTPRHLRETHTANCLTFEGSSSQSWEAVSQTV